MPSWPRRPPAHPAARGATPPLPRRPLLAPGELAFNTRHGPLTNPGYAGPTGAPVPVSCTRTRGSPPARPVAASAATTAPPVRRAVQGPPPTKIQLNPDEALR
jgi:hypothetical protein